MARKIVMLPILSQINRIVLPSKLEHGKSKENLFKTVHLELN